jgi:hypothetical protein
MHGPIEFDGAILVPGTQKLFVHVYPVGQRPPLRHGPIAFVGVVVVPR